MTPTNTFWFVAAGIFAVVVVGYFIAKASFGAYTKAKQFTASGADAEATDINRVASNAMNVGLLLGLLLGGMLVVVAHWTGLMELPRSTPGSVTTTSSLAPLPPPDKTQVVWDPVGRFLSYRGQVPPGAEFGAFAKGTLAASFGPNPIHIDPGHTKAEVLFKRGTDFSPRIDIDLP